MQNVTVDCLNAETVKSLNNLLAYLHDSHKGYHESSTNVEDMFLKTRFTMVAEVRKDMIDEIEKFLILNNQKPVDSGTLVGTAHRIFVDLKSFVMGKDKDVILNEVIRGENILAKQYQEALATSIGSPIKSLLTEQLETVKEDLEKWNSLDDDK